MWCTFSRRHREHTGLDLLVPNQAIIAGHDVWLALCPTRDVQTAVSGVAEVTTGHLFAGDKSTAVDFLLSGEGANLAVEEGPRWARAYLGHPVSALDEVSAAGGVGGVLAVDYIAQVLRNYWNANTYYCKEESVCHRSRGIQAINSNFNIDFQWCLF